MTTAAERSARRAERLQKELERKIIWTTLKYIGAYIGFITAAYWLGIVMYENPEWAFAISWVTMSLGTGAVLFRKAAK